MSEERKAFIEALKKAVGDKTPTAEQERVTDAAQNFYFGMEDGKIVSHVTKTMVVYARAVLPELSTAQVRELTYTVHTIITTVLSYLVEAGLIKEE